jgi:hypothetical protein
VDKRTENFIDYVLPLLVIALAFLLAKMKVVEIRILIGSVFLYYGIQGILRKKSIGRSRPFFHEGTNAIIVSILHIIFGFSLLVLL